MAGQQCVEASRDDRENRVKQPDNIADATRASRLDATPGQLAPLADSNDRMNGSRRTSSEDTGAALPKVLLIDDDCAYRAELSRYLRSNGFDSLESDSFKAACEVVRASPRAFVIVPELTVGSRHLFDYLAQMKRTSGAAILVLSNRPEETEKIVALEVGADDFIPKTTDRREILARIRAAARRLPARRDIATPPEAKPVHGTAQPAGSWRFLPARRELIDPEGRPVRLTTAEFSLLDAFVENTGSPLSRNHLAMAVLGRNSYASDRGIDNLVAKLRRKLRESARLGRMIKTARPVGYVFTGFSAAETRVDTDSVISDAYHAPSQGKRPASA